MAADWPKDVTPVGVEDLNRLGIDTQHQLFRDGRRIAIRRRLDLTCVQNLAAILVTLFALLGGIGGFFSGLTDASAFLRARHLHWLSCPLPPAP